MARAIVRSMLTGVAGALLFFVLGLAGESVIAERLGHATAPKAESAPTPPPTADGFVVATSDTLVSEVSWEDPYLIPASAGVLVLVSAWTYRRLRRSEARR